ncbi:MAG: hypothetical protein IPG24_02985 [Leptospiraceae bacterium]|nr:hypothetical protein [Leptospiraceae bacterium]
MHFSKRNLFLFLIFFSALSHLLFRFLVLYSEKTSFIWHTIGTRVISPKEYDLAILGDSQLMSGIHPNILNKLLKENGKQTDILYYPRPSEQPEGIYKLLIDFKNSGIKIKTLVVNVSPVTSSKNTIVDAHKTLSQNFQPFSLRMLLDSELNKFYFKNLSGNIYYLFLQVFPLLKLNGNFSNEIKLIPGSEGIQHNKEMNALLNVNFFGNLNTNKEKNLFLENSLINENFYFEWGNFSPFTGECVERKETLSLPAGMEAAFLTPRKESLSFWLKIGKYAKENQIRILYLYIPFSPEAEAKIRSNESTSPIQMNLHEISSQIGEDSIMKIEPKLFNSSDFKDYTHLNVCGMMKLTKELANRL